VQDAIPVFQLAMSQHLRVIKHHFGVLILSAFSHFHDWRIFTR